MTTRFPSISSITGGLKLFSAYADLRIQLSHITAVLRKQIIMVRVFFMVLFAAMFSPAISLKAEAGCGRPDLQTTRFYLKFKIPERPILWNEKTNVISVTNFTNSLDVKFVSETSLASIYIPFKSGSERLALSCKGGIYDKCWRHSVPYFTSRGNQRDRDRSVAYIHTESSMVAGEISKAINHLVCLSEEYFKKNDTEPFKER
jgi:hypothetical protein